MKKYYIGAYAGNIGTSNTGYPITDHFLVMVKDGETDRVKAIYQVQEVRGIIENGEFVEAKPKCENISNCSLCEPEYEMTYWVGDRSIPKTELETQYKVKDITAIVKAAAAFEGTNSPYVSTKHLDIFKNNRELSTRNPVDKPIIVAVKAAMKH